MNSKLCKKLRQAARTATKDFPLRKTSPESVTLEPTKIAFRTQHRRLKALLLKDNPAAAEAELAKVCDYTVGPFEVNSPRTFRGAYRALKKAVKGGLYDEKRNR